MKKQITVGIIDTDQSARDTIKGILRQGNTTSLDHTFDVLFDQAKLSDPKTEITVVPDVLILDTYEQDFRIVEQIKRRFPLIEIVIVSNIEDIKVIRKCFRHGAVSYICKQTCLQLLVSSLLTIQQGGSYVSPHITRALINQLRESKKYEELLTVRELQVANGIVDGMSYKMIAHYHALSLDTVRIYIKRIYRKLKINSKGELIAQFTV